MNKKITLLNLLLLTCFIGFSQVSLQITEIWPGNGEGKNLTKDWFEITNEGDTAWTTSLGNLYFVDDREEADYIDDVAIINGINTIEPGETVIVINDDDTTEFISVWGSVYNLTNLQIGTHDGKGLGGSGDTVNLFISSQTPSDNSTRVDSEAYPDTELNPGKSYDVVNNAFSVVGETPNFPVETEVNDENESAIGSPGNKGKSLSIDEINSSLANVFPLPFNNSLTIQLADQKKLTTTVNIINITGRVIYTEKVKFSNGKATLSLVSKLPVGVYVLRISELNIALKVIKE